jgi:RNA polymerase sigma factor (sigma-70 family)
MIFNHELNANLRNNCTTHSDTAENDRLYPRVLAGEADAKEQMIVNNLPLAISVVDEFLTKHAGFRHLRDDLIAEAFLAVVNAVQTMSPYQGENSPNPTSYLFKSVYRQLTRCLDETPLINPARHRMKHARRTRTAANIPNVASRIDINKTTLGGSAESPGVFELRDLISSCCLSPDDQTIVAMRENGSSFQEIAQAIGLSRNTTHRMYAAIRDRFDAKMKELQQ